MSSYLLFPQSFPVSKNGTTIYPVTWAKKNLYSFEYPPPTIHLSPPSFSQAITFGLATARTSYTVSLLPHSVLYLCSHSSENDYSTKSRPSCPSLVLSSLMFPKTLILKMPNLTLARRAIHNLSDLYLCLQLHFLSKGRNFQCSPLCSPSSVMGPSCYSSDISRTSSRQGRRSCCPSDWKTLPSTYKTHSRTSGLFSVVTLTIPF